eukprot:NODE_68_length_23780_cov_0.251003.p14 type:complete len:104 gc:universal NODE_68_length_23780_cov_0.251003:21507-21196(-)
MLDAIAYRHLKPVPEHMAIDVITMYENKIKHFCKYLKRFFNADPVKAYKANDSTTKQKKQQINALCRELGKAKNGIRSISDLRTSDVQYRIFVDTESLKIMPK